MPPVAGNTNTVANKAYCHRQYWLMRNSQLYWTLQNTWTYPTAQNYVERLFREAPSANCLQGQLAVITNIAANGSSYHVAEELALTAGMHLILLSKKTKKLRTIEENLLKEARRRGVQANENYRKPTIFKIQYDSNSLKSVLQAAEDVLHIAKGEAYNNKLSVLVHNPSGVTVAYETTEDGVEINVGRNFVAPVVLTQQLLPLLKEAATPTYKPRIVYVASVGHSQGTDFDPNRLLQIPEEGGAPEGTLVAPGGNSGDYAAANADDTDATSNTKVYMENEELDGPVTMYYRALFALMTHAMALAQEEPSLAPVSLYPGSVATSQKKSLGIAETIYQTGFWMFNLSARQGARASLRAALEPDLNTGALSAGSYLHCDGNPWTVADPTGEDPNTGVTYDVMVYAQKVRDCTLQLMGSLLDATKGNQEESMATSNEETPTHGEAESKSEDPETTADPISPEAGGEEKAAVVADTSSPWGTHKQPIKLSPTQANSGYN